MDPGCIVEIGKCLWVPVEPQIGYLVQYGSNVKNLESKFEKLKAMRDDNQDMVKDADDRGKRIKKRVSDWIKDEQEIEPKVKELLDKTKKNQRCFNIQWCPIRSACYQLSKDAKKLGDDIAGLLAEGEFDDVSLPLPNPGVEAIPIEGVVPLKSITSKQAEIMQILEDETNNINIIGVYGDGGTGKTTLMKQVAKAAKAGGFFKDVAIVRVSQTPNIKEIQCGIAELIGLKIEENSEQGRISRLAQRLRRKDRVLIILDDLHDRLELNDVGIPHGNEHKGCKVVVTSRTEQVCNQMDTQKNIQINRLSDDESFELFRIKAQVHQEALVQVARMITKECEGVTNAIVTVGQRLKGLELINEWKCALRKLREEAATKTDTMDIPPKVFSCLKFSVDKLGREDRTCLLFCCLFPEYYNVSMEQLVLYGLVERLFPYADTLEELRREMQTVVDSLKDFNFLLEGDRKEKSTFRVHDDTRAVVMHIESGNGSNIIARWGPRTTEWPAAEGWESCKRMSLMDNNYNIDDITRLPEKTECTQLLTLFMQNNTFEVIPESFFQCMRSLRYLDLSHSVILSLPQSFQCLEALRLLRLENAHLSDAAVHQFNGLKKLEVLILRGSCIKELPKGLGEMTNLKLLDLSNNPYLQHIPSNVLSKLYRLEELYIGNSFGEWELLQAGNQSKASFSELAYLPQLTVLHIHVKNMSCLSTNFDGPWKNLTKFCICVNDDYWDLPSAKSMHFKNLPYHVADWVKILLQKTQYLSLTRSRDIQDVILEGLQDLRELTSLHLRACSYEYIFRSSLFGEVENLEELHVEYCYSLREVFVLEEIEEEHANLTRLRELNLAGMPKLTTIWKGNLSAAHLQNLKFMKVKECQKLRNIFPKALAEKLGQLEHLAIMNCDNMEEIIAKEQIEMNEEARCFSNNIPFFQNLQKLIISKCKKMKSVLPMRLIQGLDKLEELTVVSCSQMEEIIAMGEEQKEAQGRNTLPQLKILVLENLPKLVTLYKGELLLNWPSLQDFHVLNCPGLKKPPFGPNITAPKLSKFKETDVAGLCK